MLGFDSSVPTHLKQKQQWFAGIIEQPIDDNSLIQPLAPSGRLIKEEACDYIASSLRLKAAERIQIYNQQFWWRLLHTLHEEFPLLTRLFGYKDFNKKIGFPYIQKYLPNHWSLSFLGNRLFRFAEEEYKEHDKKLILEAIRLDWANNYSFIAAHHLALGYEEGVDLTNIENLISKIVYLQPHIFLFETEFHIFEWREKCLEFDADYWQDNDFPKPKPQINKPYFFIFYRNTHNFLVHDEIDAIEYRLLHHFLSGNTIENVIEWIEQQNDSIQKTASENLQEWLQKWILNQWLYPPVASISNTK